MQKIHKDLNEYRLNEKKASPFDFCSLLAISCTLSSLTILIVGLNVSRKGQTFASSATWLGWAFSVFVCKNEYTLNNYLILNFRFVYFKKYHLIQ